VLLPRVAAVVALATVLAGCATEPGPTGPTSTTSTAADAATESPSASSTAPTTRQWCASYAVLTSVLAQSSSDATGAATALQALDRFEQLWGVAGTMGILTPAEVLANQRAVASYRTVMSLVAGGATPTTPALVTARAQLAAQTATDHALLSSSAGKVLALCGTVTGSTTASPTA
jgi:hypothetical protein